MHNRAQYLILAIIVLGSIAYILMWGLDPVIAQDTRDYIRYAADLAKGGIPPLQWRTPGFPMLIYLTGSAITPSSMFIIVQLVMYGLAVFLQTRILKGIGLKDKYIVLYTAVMFLPTFIDFAFIMMAENLTMVSMTVSLYAVWKWTQTNKWWYGLIAVLSIIVEFVTRPSNQFEGIMYGLMLVFIVWFVPGMRTHWKSYARKALVLAIGPMIYLMGISTYYYQQTGYFGQTSLSSIAWLTRMWRMYERIPDEHKVLRDILLAERNQLLVHGESHTGFTTLMRTTEAIGDSLGLNEYETMKYIQKVGIDLILRAPMNYLYEAASTSSGYWLPNVSARASGPSTAMKLLWSGFQLVFIAAFLLLALWYLFHLLSWKMGIEGAANQPGYTAIAKRIMPGILLILSPILYFYLLYIAVAHPDTRYRDPLEPFMLMGVFVILYFIGELRSYRSTTKEPGTPPLEG